MAFPPVNAIGPELLSAMAAELRRTLSDESVAVVLLASALDVFCAGADAKWLGRLHRKGDFEHLVAQFEFEMDKFREIGMMMRRSNVLFIAAIDGHTLAGGLELAAACDLRFASDDNRIQIGVPEMSLFGEPPSGGGGTQYLARMMGGSRSLRFILEGDPCSPRTALELGIVDRLCPPERLLPISESLAERVGATAGRTGIGSTKRAIFDGLELPLDQAMQLDRSVHRAAMRSASFRRGMTAFVERFGR